MKLLQVIFELNEADFSCLNLFFKGIQLFASLGFGAIARLRWRKNPGGIVTRKNQKNEIK